DRRHVLRIRAPAVERRPERQAEIRRRTVARVGIDVEVGTAARIPSAAAAPIADELRARIRGHVEFGELICWNSNGRPAAQPLVIYHRRTRDVERRNVPKLRRLLAEIRVHLLLRDVAMVVDLALSAEDRSDVPIPTARLRPRPPEIRDPHRI